MDFFPDNFYGHLRHFKDINIFTFRSHKNERKQETHLYRKRHTFISKDFSLFMTNHVCFLFRDNFLESLGHFKKSVFQHLVFQRSIGTAKYFQDYKCYFFLNLRAWELVPLTDGGSLFLEGTLFAGTSS